LWAVHLSRKLAACGYGCSYRRLGGPPPAPAAAPPIAISGIKKKQPKAPHTIKR
jgi:hypothetical protein